MDTFKVKGTTYRFETPPTEGGPGADLLIERRDRVLTKAAKASGRTKVGQTYVSVKGLRTTLLANPVNILADHSANLLTEKMAADAGQTITYPHGVNNRTAVVWSPGPYANTVWATSPDSRFVCLRRLRDGSWFKEDY